MGYILVFLIGGFIGFSTSAIMSFSSYTDKSQEAYNAGYKAGLEKNKTQV